LTILKTPAVFSHICGTSNDYVEGATGGKVGRTALLPLLLWRWRGAAEGCSEKDALCDCFLNWKILVFQVVDGTPVELNVLHF